MRACWLLPILVATLLAPAPHARDDDGPEEFAEDVIDRLEEAIDEDDIEAVHEAILDFDLVYDNVGERTQKKIRRALERFMATEPRPVQGELGEPPEQRLEPSYAAAIGILYDKPGGVEVLRDTLDEDHLEEWWSVRGLLYEAIALNLDPDDIELIAEGLEEPHPWAVTSAARSLAIYKEQELEVRRAALEALIEGWEEILERVEKEARRESGTEQRERRKQVEPALLEAAADLSRRRHADLAELRAWFEEHGSGEDW